jgi:hypothetical protein
VARTLFSYHAGRPFHFVMPTVKKQLWILRSAQNDGRGAQNDVKWPVMVRTMSEEPSLWGASATNAASLLNPEKKSKTSAAALLDTSLHSE